MDATLIIQYFRNHLLESLSLPSTESLVIILDSIDQLSAADGAHSMNWLPKTLPNKLFGHNSIHSSHGDMLHQGECNAGEYWNRYPYCLAGKGR